MSNKSSQAQKGERATARTAMKVLERLGEDRGSLRVFEGRAYEIIRLKPDPQLTRLDPDIKSQLSIIAKDGRGEILRLNNKEFVSKLQATDIHKFAQLEQKLHQNRLKQELPSNSQPKKSTSTVISKESEVEVSKAVEVNQTAANLLKLLGEKRGEREIFEGKDYTITKTKSYAGKKLSLEFSIVAKDGRGEILKINNREFTSKLEDKDVHKFAQIQQKIGKYEAKKQQLSQQQTELSR